MRKELQKKDEQRLKFTAVFGRYGSKINWNGYSETTLLLTELRYEDGSPAAAHIWLTETKGLRELGPFKQGQQLEFEARIGEYEKGYKYRGKALTPTKVDFKLNRVTKVRKVG